MRNFHSTTHHTSLHSIQDSVPLLSTLHRVTRTKVSGTESLFLSGSDPTFSAETMRPTLMSSLEMSTARSTAASFGPFVGVAPFASRDTKQYQVFTTKNLLKAMGYSLSSTPSNQLSSTPSYQLPLINYLSPTPSHKLTHSHQLPLSSTSTHSHPGRPNLWAFAFLGWQQISFWSVLIAGREMMSSKAPP